MVCLAHPLRDSDWVWGYQHEGYCLAVGEPEFEQEVLLGFGL